MDNLIWKIKQFISNLVPIALFCALIYGGWNLYKQGAFRHGVKPAIATIVSKVPYFGSRFRHYIVSSGSKEYARSSGKKRGHSKAKSRRSRRRHRR